ncbi:Pectinesterase [Handroanthus impetiginosus]|uniref:Pectinesterase n=1 Tax=Handroanthus impetiginosus TaxID=429701 RepID=A0A2G9H3G1_9LAMI|nr:Pectinesterase [Handroanthus impetiginosus]
MAGADKKKKIAVAGLASILLVAMCVAVAVGVTRKSGGGDVGSSGNNGGGSSGSISASTKAVQAICAPTDYKETCEKSLSNANTTDPKELIKVAFNVAMENIGCVLKQSTLLKEAASDPSTKDAYSVCEEVLEDAVEDLKRSADKVGEFDVSKVNEYVEDVKTWLSAVITYQETCIDAFENVTGDNGEKMKNLLQTARELSSNGLAMVTDISSILSSLQLGNLGSRRLLSEEGRELYFKDPTDYAPGEEPHYVKRGRRLLSAWRANAVVAQDGSGQFRKINDAIAQVPKKNKNTFVIHVKAGLYKENVIVPKGAHKIVLMGDGPLKTRITGNKCFAKGTKTFQSATVAINADDFVAKDIAFENTAGPEGHQAVALRVSGDRAVFFNVHIDGHQDSLYAHTYRQYYRDCSISGTIDFIFGDSLAIFQNCKFIVRKPMNNQACMVTAQGRVDPRSQGAIVIQNGDIQAEPAFLATKPAIQAYLGRPWKQLSRTIIMQSNIGGFIAPEGWSPWMGDFALDTLYYAEYQNRGPGSDLRRRVHWKGIRHINAQIADSFTGGRAFGGDYWIRAAGVPYVPTLMRV